MKKGLFILTLAFILGLTACNKISKSDLKVEKTKWETLGATKYAYDFNADCFCFGLEILPARLVVENNILTEVIDIQTGETKKYENGVAVIDSLPGTLLRNMDELFDVVERARTEASVLEVSFDETNGFPTSIVIDWEKKAVDDELSYTISNFEQL